MSKSSSKWYNIMPWWAWLVSGLICTWIGGVTGIVPIGIYGPIAVIIGLCVGIGRLVESKRH